MNESHRSSWLLRPVRGGKIQGERRTPSIYIYIYIYYVIHGDDGLASDGVVVLYYFHNINHTPIPPNTNTFSFSGLIYLPFSLSFFFFSIDKLEARHYFCFLFQVGIRLPTGDEGRRRWRIFKLFFQGLWYFDYSKFILFGLSCIITALVQLNDVKIWNYLILLRSKTLYISIILDEHFMVSCVQILLVEMLNIAK